MCMSSSPLSLTISAGMASGPRVLSFFICMVASRTSSQAGVLSRYVLSVSCGMDWTVWSVPVICGSGAAQTAPSIVVG